MCTGKWPKFKANAKYWHEHDIIQCNVAKLLKCRVAFDTFIIKKHSLSVKTTQFLISEKKMKTFKHIYKKMLKITIFWQVVNGILFSLVFATWLNYYVVSKFIYFIFG